MQNKDILIEYTITGGMPPSSFESLQIYSDGRVRSLVGNAWAEGERQNEAGLYETRLDREEKGSLDQLMGNAKLRNTVSTFGKMYPGSTKEILTFPEGGKLRKMQWPTGSDLPEILIVLRKLLNQILVRSKGFPQNVVRLKVDLDETEVQLGNTLLAKCNLFNPGADSVSLAGPNIEGSPPQPVLRYLLEPWNEFDEKVVPLIQVFEAGEIAQMVDFGVEQSEDGRFTLPPKRSFNFSFQVDSKIRGKGTYNFFVMLEFLMQVYWDGEINDSYSVVVVQPLKIQLKES